MKNTIHQICFIAMMTAVTAVLSILVIPTFWGVPFTLQTFAVALCGYLLGKRDGTIAVLLYVLLGLVGVPVFAGMKSGPATLAGPTGGYILGFIFMAFLCGLQELTEKNKYRFIFAVAFGIFGLMMCHTLGVIQLKRVAGLSWKLAFTYGTLPYIVKDLISTIGAYVFSIVLKKALSRAQINVWSD